MNHSTSEFLDHLQRSKLLSPERIEDVRADTSNLSGGDQAMAARLVENGSLTEYQSQHLLAGHAEGFFVSKYKILEPIGEGGMGKVFRAEDIDLQREVALKILSPQAIQDERMLTRFRREARAAARLNHENVVQVYDVGEHRQTHFIAMELIEGEVLSSLMKRQRLEWPQITQISHGIASALAAAHARGVLHRDIKPSNVIVRPNDQVKVVDFGLARLQPTSRLEQQSNDSTTTRTGTVIGTIPYMSPEQAAGEPLTTESDMFSLGSLLYELSTGQTPFRSSSTLGTLDAIIHDEPLRPSQLNPNIPEQLEVLIIQLLAKDHHLRLSAEEAQSSLAELISGGNDFKHAVSAERVSSQQTLCVGRDEELARLTSAAQMTWQGQGSLLCVVGEAGVGKTTLVERFLEQLRSSSELCTILCGSCSERLAGSDGYLPFLEALGDLLAGDRRRRAAELMRLTAPSWYAQVLTTQTNVLTDSQLVEVRSASQERMKREIVSFLQGLGRTLPVVIFLDDLHWVDISTADLITYLAGKCASMRLLLVCSYRPTVMALSKNPFIDAKLELHTRGICEELALDPLGQEAIQVYLDLQFPQHCFPKELGEVILARTEGNALFLVDLVRDLRESGVLMQEEGTWVLSRKMNEVEQHIPDSVRSMVRRKVEQLDDADRRMLIAASVQGAEFHAAVIAETLSVDECDVEERLEFLTHAHGLVRRIREEELPDSRLTLRYAFAHALYHNAFYGTLTPARRVRISAQVAAALAEFYESDRAEIALELALLFETAREFAKASDCFLQASENAASH